MTASTSRPPSSPEEFEGLRPIARHQRVYRALGERMKEEIHALSMKTLTPTSGARVDRLVIEGGVPLYGEIPVSGAKNAALKMLAAGLLSREPLELTNVPRLKDVSTMLEILQLMGVVTRQDRHDRSHRGTRCNAA